MTTLRLKRRLIHVTDVTVVKMNNYKLQAKV